MNENMKENDGMQVNLQNVLFNLVERCNLKHMDLVVIKNFQGQLQHLSSFLIYII